MISEAELKELSYPDAPQMVTQVPGPKVAALMAESARYEAFTRGGADFPVILEQGRGATAKDADGNLYIDMAAGVAVNAVGRDTPRCWRPSAASAEHHAHHRHHQPQAHRAGQDECRRSCPRACAATATPPSSRPVQTPWRPPSSSHASTRARARSSPSRAPITGCGAAPPPSLPGTTTATAGGR